MFSILTSKITFLEIEEMLNHFPEDNAPFEVVLLDLNKYDFFFICLKYVDAPEILRFFPFV